MEARDSTLQSDVTRLAQRIQTCRINDSKPASRGWNHIGAVVVDAVLQRRQKYSSTVLPRVQLFIADYPESHTTEGVRELSEKGEISNAICWKSDSVRITQIEEITSTLEACQIDTVDQWRVQYVESKTRLQLRSRLSVIRYVGPKTLDYFEILVGIPTAIAIDFRIRRICKESGITNPSYDYLSDVIRNTARPSDGDLTTLMRPFGRASRMPPSRLVVFPL